MIEFYRDILIQIREDEFGFHWEAYQGNRCISDSSKQGGFENKKEALTNAQSHIDWLLNFQEDVK